MVCYVTINPAPAALLHAGRSCLEPAFRVGPLSQLQIDRVCKLCHSIDQGYRLLLTTTIFLSLELSYGHNLSSPTCAVQADNRPEQQTVQTWGGHGRG